MFTLSISLLPVPAQFLVAMSLTSLKDYLMRLTQSNGSSLTIAYRRSCLYLPFSKEKQLSMPLNYGEQATLKIGIMFYCSYTCIIDYVLCTYRLSMKIANLQSGYLAFNPSMKVLNSSALIDFLFSRVCSSPTSSLMPATRA